MTEMSILVISLAATFYGENLIESYHEAQDDKATMGMVVEELQYDLEVLGEMKKLYEAELEFSRVLESALVHHTVLPSDSVEKYKNFHRIYYYWTLKASAFDFVKVSGVMQRVEDKALIVQLFECYERLNIMKELDSDFRTEHRTRLSEFRSRLKDGKHGDTVAEQWEQIDGNEDYKRYLLYSLPPLANSINEQIEVVAKSITKTVRMIKANYKID